MAGKPTIFFSHSSRDAQLIGRLKAHFLRATGGSVDVFLSTDGQSIPLGRNWVHKIEEALEHAGFMVVFVTPNSLRSNWIFFESGFVYGKKIRVVPVGFLGVDLAALSPPLSLLQGFNITSEEGLNNILALTNEVFQHSHRPAFSSEDYREICGVSEAPSTSVLGEYGNLVDTIHSQLIEKLDLSCTVREALNLLAKILDREGVEYKSSQYRVDLYGISFTFDPNVLPHRINLQIDPWVADVAFPVLEKTFSELRAGGIRGTRISLHFVPTVACLHERHKITARVSGTNVKMAHKNHLERDDIRFNFDQLVGFNGHRLQGGATYLDMELLGTTVPTQQIRELLAFLFERQLLFVEPHSTF